MIASKISKISKISKKIISLIAATAIGCSIISTPVLADWTTEGYNLENTEVLLADTKESNMPEMKTAVVKLNAAGTGYDIVNDIGTPEKDQIIIIGIQAKNFNRFQHNTTNSGLFAISTSLVYDTRYLEPTKAYNSATWKDDFGLKATNLLRADQSSWYYKPNKRYEGSYSMDDSYQEAQELFEDEDSDLDSNKNNLRKVVTSWAYRANNATNQSEQLSIVGTDEFIAYYEFKVKAKPSEGNYSKGVQLSKSSNIALAFGNTGLTRKAYTANDGLHRYLKLTDGVNLWSSDNPVLTGLTMSPSNYTVPTQYVGKALNLGTTPPTFTAVYDPDTSNKAVENGDDGFAYKLGVANNTAVGDLTDVPKSLTANENGSYLFATYTDGDVTKAVCLGQLSVSAKAITGITFDDDNSTFNDTGNTYYTSQKILAVLKGENAKTLTADITYNNGDDDGDDVLYTAFPGKGIALYQIKDNKLAAIGEEDKFAESNTFYIAETGKAGQDPTAVTIKSGAITVSATKDTTVIKPNSANGGKLKYTSDATEVDADGKHLNVIDFKDVKLTVKNASQADTAYSEKTVSEIGTSNLIFYVGASENPAENAYAAGKTTIKSGTTPYTSALKDKYVFVVPADDTAATPVRVGQLKNRAISTDAEDIKNNSVANIKTTLTYGDTVENALHTPKDDDANPPVPERNASITLTYDNGDTKELSYKYFETEGITMKIVKADGTTVVVDSATDQTVLTPDMSGDKIGFYYGNKKIGESTALTVNKKTIYYTPTTDAPKKEYDGDTEIKGTTSVKIQISKSDLETNDQTGIETPNVGLEGLKVVYKTADVEKSTDTTATGDDVYKTKTLKVVPVDNDAVANVPSINGFTKKYNVQPNTEYFTTDNELKNLKGIITPKKLEITLKEGVIPVEKQDQAADEDVIVTGTLADNDYSVTDGSVLNDDKTGFKITYSAVIDKTKVTQDSDTKFDPKSITLTPNNTNYTATNVSLANTAIITSDPLQKIEIAFGTAPNATEDLTLTYPNIKPTETALDSMVVTGKYGKSDTEINNSKDKTLAASEYTVTIDGNAVDANTNLTYGDHTIRVTVGDIYKEATIHVKKKPIKLSDITFTASKVYGDDEVDGEATFSTEGDKGLVAADIGKVQVTATYTFTDEPESAGGKKNVTISNIALTGDAAGNYVIVNGNENDTPITTATTTTINTGTIEPAKEAAPTQLPTVSVDSKTNKLVINSTLGDKVKYSVDGTKWYTEAELEAIQLNPGQTVTVQIKTLATANHIDSESADIGTFTAFKNCVQIFKANSDTLLEKVYVNDIVGDTIKSKSDVASALDISLSRVKEFYTDKEAKTAVTYPLEITGNKTLYMTQTSGGSGGGGGGSAVTITLDKTSVSGEVGNSEKVTATIKGSTATPKWTSSNEKVATVDQNGNITFVGEGKATVKINVSGTVKSVAVTVTAAKATPIPTVKPTAEPTDKPSEPDKPIIDVNYTKPYASGYEDDTFRPENKITRAELAAMIARLSYGDDLPDGAYVSSFPDIEADAWFNKYVGYLEDKNVLNGYEDGTFRPNDTVTRGEISTVIARAQRYELIPYSGIFADVTDSDWAKDYIQTLAEQGIISGYEDGTFGPYSPLSRAEAVTIINNVLAPSAPIVTFTPNDIAGHWAEANIILAVNERMLGGTWSEDLNPVEIPTPEATEAPAEEEAPAPEATEAPAEEVVPEGELDPTVKDEPAVPVNPEA